MAGRHDGSCFFRFTLTSPSLKIEVKYALWYKFDSGEWDRRKRQDRTHAHLACLIKWLNIVAPTGPSLLEKDLAFWVGSLRSYLVETKQLRYENTYPQLRATQQYVEYQIEDRRIRLLRQLYGIIELAYDDRPLLERDIWDMRQLGSIVNLTNSNYKLNFVAILQPWLRALSKVYMEYSIAVCSAASCSGRIWAIREFSLFLAQNVPGCRAKDINRSQILSYIEFLRRQKRSVNWYNTLLTYLRVFLETCVHYLDVAELSKERIIFDNDFIKIPERGSREIPEEVLEQLREHLKDLDTITLRMVTILLECGMRISELCTLSLDCLIYDDRHEWYLRSYQGKMHKEHVIPLVNNEVIGIIQAQQQDMKAKWGGNCPYLFPSIQSHLLPFKQNTFRDRLNEWAVTHQIKDRMGAIYRFTAHPFRHSLGMRLINDDVPLEVISRLLGHRSLVMTQVYARVRDKKMRTDLERAALKRKTIDAQGQTVKGDSRANDPEAQLIRKGVRGQTLPVGGCGRLIVLGDCSHANKCLTCPMWLTSTDDLPKLKSFYERAIRLKQRASEKGNQFVIDQQEHIISALTIRIKSLEEPSMDGTLVVDEVLEHLWADLIEAEIALEEVRAYGLIPAAKYLERTITDLKAKIAALEKPA
jgi:integrase/recombinase XerD